MKRFWRSRPTKRIGAKLKKKSFFSPSHFNGLESAGNKGNAFTSLPLLSVPFNIASYSLLTSMLAQVCGYRLGEFIHVIGDAHIYSNHLEQVREQIKREPRKLPILKLNPEIKSLFDFRFEDISLENYEPYPPIRAKKYYYRSLDTIPLLLYTFSSSEFGEKKRVLSKRVMCKKQQLKQITVYDRKIIHDAFYTSIEGLERYIKVVYSDCKTKKQIRNNKFESYYQSEVENAAKIDVNNCPPKLKHYLFEVGEILEGRGEKLKRDTEIYSNSFEYNEQLNRVFATMQIPLSKVREMENENRDNFNGDAKRDDFDQEGKLNFGGNSIYRLENFDACQRFKIKKALNVSVDCLTNDEKDFYLQEKEHLASLIKQKIYEPERGNEEKHEELEKAQGEARWLRKELDGEIPILSVHHHANEYTDFSSVRDKVKRPKFYGGQTGSAYRIYPIIPFKSKEKIKEQLAKAIYKSMGKSSGSCYKYCLASNNCEHFAFMSILGVHHSKQAEEHPTATSIWCSRGVHSDCIANGNRKTICLRNEIRNTDNSLDNLASAYDIAYEKGRIEEYLKTQIEIPPKDCKLIKLYKLKEKEARGRERRTFGVVYHQSKELGNYFVILPDSLYVFFLTTILVFYELKSVSGASIWAEKATEKQTEAENNLINNRKLIIKKGLTNNFLRDYQQISQTVQEKISKETFFSSLYDANDFVIFTMFTKLTTSFNYLMKGVRKYPQYSSVQKRFNYFLSLPERNDIQKNVLISEPITSIVLQKVSFFYEKDKRVLKELDLVFEKGKVNHLQAPNGFGKTTIIDLLFGFYQPSGGKVIINRKYELKELNLKNWRKKISYAESANLVKSNLSLGQKQLIDLQNTL
nr:11759_t:CDS:10 [Entrophospora candida]